MDMLVIGWKQVIRAVLSDNYIKCSIEKWSDNVLWSNILSSRTLINWDENIATKSVKKLIEIVLTLPTSSAEAERGFSIMGQVRTKVRARLTPENLEAIMNIRK